jgi:hypothetical protein
MLDSHPRIAVSHESEWMVPMGRRRASYRREGEFDDDRFVADLLSHSWADRVGLSEDDVRSAVTIAAPASFADAIRSVFDAYAGKHGKPRAGDKTPSYVIHIDLLAQVLPEGRFVHIVRDGRDVAMSYMDVPFGPKDMREAAMFWRRRVGAGRASGTRLGPGRYLEVRYEDLVDRPEDNLRRVCAFLDAEFDPAMLRYHERAEELVSAARHPGHHGHLFHAPEKGVRDWRTTMSKDDLVLFESIAGPVLERFGYERSGVRAPARLRLAGAKLRTREAIRARRREARLSRGADSGPAGSGV